LRRVVAHRKYATAVAYGQVYATHLEPALGSFRLREIARLQIKALFDRKLDQDYPKATLRLIRAVLLGILGEAVDDDIIKVNVALSAGGCNRRADNSSRARPRPQY
jgi:hypothetical protein